MVYFSTAPVAPESLALKQYEALKAFKDWCYEQGLVESYDNISDFSNKFRRRIQMKIRDHPELSQKVSTEAVLFSEVYTAEKDGTVEERLSEEAKRLLVEAAKDQNGTIMSVRFLNGQAIQTNGVNFADSGNRRSVARWEAALEQLLREDLIVERGYKSEVFEMTAKGFEIADKLSQVAG